MEGNYEMKMFEYYVRYATGIKKRGVMIASDVIHVSIMLFNQNDKIKKLNVRSYTI